MEKIDLRPRKAMLVFWLIWVIIGSLPVGGIVAGMCSDAKINPWSGFILESIITFLIVSCYVVLYFFSIRYQIDDRYVNKNWGVLWKKQRSTPLGKITNLDVRQGPIERTLEYGQIWIFTPSTGAFVPEIKLIGVSDPHKIKQIIVARTETAKILQTNTPAQPKNNIQPDTEILSLLKDMRNSLQNIEKSLAEKSRIKN